MSVRGNPLGFVAVGIGAALIHLAMVILLVSALNWTPLQANVIAFCIAFAFSHYGHRHVSFAATAAFHQSFWRWGLVSLGGFAVNHGLYWYSLRTFPQISYYWLLVAVMLTVAVGTYSLGKLWAFSAT